MKGLEKHGTTVLQLGVRNPKPLAEIGPGKLWEVGWSEDYTAALRFSEVQQDSVKTDAHKEDHPMVKGSKALVMEEVGIVRGAVSVLLRCVSRICALHV